MQKQLFRRETACLDRYRHLDSPVWRAVHEGDVFNHVCLCISMYNAGLQQSANVAYLRCIPQPEGGLSSNTTAVATEGYTVLLMDRLADQHVVLSGMFVIWVVNF